MKDIPCNTGYDYTWEYLLQEIIGDLDEISHTPSRYSLSICRFNNTNDTFYFTYELNIKKENRFHVLTISTDIEQNLSTTHINYNGLYLYRSVKTDNYMRSLKSFIIEEYNNFQKKYL